MMVFDDAFTDFVRDHENDDTYRLALQRGRYHHLDFATALLAIEGRRVARRKLPHWHACERVVLPDKTAVEQASSLDTAGYKVALLRRLLAGRAETLVDLTGGLGVDSEAFSQLFRRIHYLESDPMRCRLACHNFRALGATNIHVHSGLAEEEGVRLVGEHRPDVIYIDPDRRPGSAKERTFLLSASTPDLVRLMPRLREASPDSLLLAKLSPMVDVRSLLRTFASPFDLHVISARRDCKEVLLLFSPLSLQSQATIVEIGHRHCYREILPIEEAPVAPLPICSEEELHSYTYLYDLYPSRAKLEHLLPIRIPGVCRLAPDTQIYLSQDYLSDFPGRSFRVHDMGRWTKQERKRWIGRTCHVVAKNIPESSEQIRQKLRTNPGEEEYLFLFRTQGGAPWFCSCSH